MTRVGLTVEEAVKEILQKVNPVAATEIPLRESFQYVLAEDVKVQIPVPPFDRSMMDGYAIRYEDAAGASPEQPARLKVVGRIAAGEVWEKELQAGEAVRIMTGAPVPKGADAIAKFEITDAQHNPEAAEIHVLLSVREGEAISVKGEDMQIGRIILKKGTFIGAAEMALLATVGVPTVIVFKKPVIGVLSSGHELVEIDQPLAPGKIYNSNTYMLAGLIAAWGGVPYLFDQVDDQLDEVTEAIRDAMPIVDALVTTGGVSVGDFDVMRSAYEQARGQVHFWKVNVRPGTPFTFAEVQNKPVFGLSGNPAAGFVNAMLFLQPAIRAMSGRRQSEVPVCKMKLAVDPQMKMIGLDRFLRAKIVIENGEAAAYPLPTGQSAGIMSSLTGIQGFVRIPGRTEVKLGDLVETYLLDFPINGETDNENSNR